MHFSLRANVQGERMKGGKNGAFLSWLFWSGSNLTVLIIRATTSERL